jgi:DNA repair ATPase RecN
MIASNSTLLKHNRPSPTTLTNVSEVLASLAALEDEEQELSQSLSELLSSRQPVYSAFAALQTLSPQVDSTCQDAALLARKVAVTAETADRIGSKVGRLDEEMRRVKSAVERVGKTMELKASAHHILHYVNAYRRKYANSKSSLSDLHAAMESRDWEAAARHCARAMSFPPEVLTGPFSDLVVVSIRIDEQSSDETQLFAAHIRTSCTPIASFRRS